MSARSEEVVSKGVSFMVLFIGVLFDFLDFPGPTPHPPPLEKKGGGRGLVGGSFGVKICVKL